MNRTLLYEHQVKIIRKQQDKAKKRLLQNSLGKQPYTKNSLSDLILGHREKSFRNVAVLMISLKTVKM